MDGEPGYTLLERLSARPTFDIHAAAEGIFGAAANLMRTPPSP